MKTFYKASSDEFTFSLIQSQEEKQIWSHNLEVVFVLKGSGRLCLRESHANYDIKQEDLFVINPFELYMLNLDKDSYALSLSITPMFIAAFCKELPDLEINCKSYLFESNQQEIFHVIRRDLAYAFQTQYKNESPLPVLLRSRVGILLADLVKNFGSARGKKGINSSVYDNLRKATDYIHKHYEQEISLGDIANATFLSSSYLSHMFQKQLGQTFTSYLTDVRLSHAVTLLLGEQTVTDIALMTGFPSSNAFIEAFKRCFGMTPGQYRKQSSMKVVQDMKQTDKGEEFYHVFSSLASYINTTVPVTLARENVETTEISCDVSYCKQILKHKWRYLMNAGYAKDVLNVHVRSQVMQVQEEIGYQYIRCKGYLDDDMMVCLSSLDDGTPVYNFTYIDEVVDFILSVNALPWIELGHMPAILARNYYQLFRRPCILSMPKHMDEWLALIQALMEHLNTQYGKETVASWIITPFVTPEYALWDLFRLEEYFELYNQTINVIKSVNPMVRIAAAGMSFEPKNITEKFIEYCIKQQCLPDLLSFQVYHNIDPEEEDTGLHLMARDEAFPVVVSGDEDFLYHRHRQMRTFLSEKGLGMIPIILSEWSNNIWQRDLCNDTSYKSTYFFKNILENYDCFDGMGYWTISDQMEEIAPSTELFHGGFGLFTRKGLPKAGYRALMLLKQMGNRLLKKGEGYFITSHNKAIQIFVYNYTHYDTLYRYRHTTDLSKTERYHVFNVCKPLRLHIRLNHMEAGSYNMVCQSISPDGGNAYDAWIRMGAPAIVPDHVQNALYHQSYPLIMCKECEVKEEYFVTVELQPHEVQLITLTPK